MFDAATFNNIDLAQISLYIFWLFFALLVYYLQTENMREGYPLENEDGGAESWNLPLPAPKTFKLPHGRGEVTVPDYKREAREVALKRVGPFGYPLEPTGDPMLDGVGPAAWAPRRDEPELDGKGHPKIRPMKALHGFEVSAGIDPRGLQVQAGDGEVVGKVADLWVDEPEQMVRYIEIDLDAAWGGGKRLVPIGMARIWPSRLQVRSIFGKHFKDVPQTKKADVITKLEEEKISTYYAGGTLYASPARQEPQLG
jgi:photosynthetic reaction center H subunit